MKLLATLAVLTAGVVACFAASAHAASPWDYRPVAIDDGPTDARTAYTIANPQKGHIGYHTARAEAPALWFRFEGAYGSRTRIRMGVPALDRYRLLRPAVALLGPGLPPLEEDVPFEIPAGYGGYVYHASDLDMEYHEDTTIGVISWRFAPVEHALTVSGRHYLVGFIPLPPSEDRAGYPDGKFWMSLGDQTNFALWDIFTIYPQACRVRAFFETATTQSNLFRNTLLFLVLLIASVTLAVA